MPISFGGINTGLPANIVEQMMEVEKLPIKTLEATKGKSEARMKLVTELETKVTDIRKGLSELANVRGFTDVKLNSGDPTIVNGTVDPNNYVAGNWNVEVMSLAEKASAVTNGFPDKDKTQVGTGYMRFKTAAGEKDVYIKGDSNTLEGVSKAINQAHVGIRASVINDRKTPDAPFKLILSSDGTGTDKDVEYPRVYMLDGDQDLFFEGGKPAKNGVVKVDGVEFEVSDNSLKDVLPGVTLDLKSASPGKSVSIGVKEDMEAVSGKVKTFVDGMNGVLTFIQTQNKLDKSTDTSKTLGGDGLIRSVEQRMRSIVQNPQYGVKGKITLLSQVGISFNRNGLLDFDQKKFNAVLNADAPSVQQFLVGDGFSTGLISSVKREINTLLNPAFGPVATRSKSLKQKIDQIDERIETKTRQLEKKEQTLKDKFSRLEENMSRLKSQGSQLAAMGGGGGGGISQLIQASG